MIADLDRQIAELKGLKVDGLGGIETATPGIFELSLETWSTSDSKALELVDEMASIKDDRMGEVFFSLARKRSRGAIQWEATFAYLVAPSLRPNTFEAIAPTRAEAICRAYIAAREFLNQKGKQ